MKIYLDFKCQNGHKTEARVESSANFIICPVCKKNAKRCISTPRFTVNGAGAYDDGVMK